MNLRQIEKILIYLSLEGGPLNPNFLKRRSGIPELSKLNRNHYDLSCSYNWTCLAYAVSLWTEVSAIEGRKDAYFELDCDCCGVGLGTTPKSVKEVLIMSFIISAMSFLK